MSKEVLAIGTVGIPHHKATSVEYPGLSLEAGILLLHEQLNFSSQLGAHLSVYTGFSMILAVCFPPIESVLHIECRVGEVKLTSCACAQRNLTFDPSLAKKKLKVESGSKKKKKKKIARPELSLRLCAHMVQ